MTMKKPESLDQLKTFNKPIINAHEKHKESLTKLEKIALWITNHVGTMGFFLIIFTWTISWLTWNTIAPSNVRFDPFPAFVLWLFISNMIQICLMPLIMIGQNLQNRYSEIRSQSDYEVDVRVEKEVGVIIQHLEYIESILEGKGNE
jgi:uncharacterized membrane protein